MPVSPGALRWILAAVTLVVILLSASIVVVPQLDADDYRYLDLVQQWRAGQVDLRQASIIENRWDHLWWIASDQVVRFFRPTLILSYLFDVVVHGGSARGMLITNGLLYLATCLLATLLLARIVRHTGATALASVLFAGFAAHSETIWYIAGRNETLAALGFLLALWLHTGSGRARYLALPCYLFALASKELTLPLPLLALLLDRLVNRRAETWIACVRTQLTLYAGYVAAAAGYLLLRQYVLTSAGGSDLVFPYFVAPSRPDFPLHLWHQLRTYGENLLLGGITPPFLRADQVATHTTWFGTLLTCTAAPTIVWWLRRDPRAWFCVALAVCTWLPTSVVYVSERYLFLPSFGVAGIAGLAIVRAPRVFGVLVGVWCAHQGAWLFHKNRVISQMPHDMTAVHEHLAKVAATLPPGKPIYVLSLPTDTFGAQFFANAVRVVLRDHKRECHVLSMLPDDLVGMRSASITRRSPHEFEVRGVPLLMQHSPWLFPWTTLATGTRVTRARLGCEVEIVDGDVDHCRAVRFRLPRPLDDCVFVRFALPSTHAPMLKGALIREGRLDIIKP